MPASISTGRLLHGAPLRPPSPLLGRAYVRVERKQRALKYASRGDELDLSIALNFTDLGREGCLWEMLRSGVLIKFASKIRN